MRSTPWGIDALDIEEKEQKEQVQKEQDEINRIYAICFSTEAGQKVLEHLKKCTLEQPTWIPTEANFGINNGFLREGQNSVVRDILNRISNVNNK